MIILKHYTGVQKLAQEPALQLTTIYCCNIQNILHEAQYILKCACRHICPMYMHHCIVNPGSTLSGPYYQLHAEAKGLSTLSGLVCKIVNCKTDVDCFFQNKLLSDVFKIILVGVKHRKLNGGYLFYEDDVTT